MKQRTLCLPPGRVSPGMTLAKSAVDREGHTLLSAGTELEAEMLDRLVRRGVEALYIVVPDPRDEETIARDLAEAEERIRTIFRSPDSAAKAALLDAVLHYRQEALK